MNVATRRIALTSVSAALIVVFNALPMGLPPSINPLPLRVPSTLLPMIVAMVDPWAAALGSLIGHFSYDYVYLGLGALPALFGPWCFVIFGYLMKRKGGPDLWKVLVGSVICIGWITATLTISFWLLGVMPLAVAFNVIFFSITPTLIICDVILVSLLPRLRQVLRLDQKMA